MSHIKSLSLASITMIIGLSLPAYAVEEITGLIVMQAVDDNQRATNDSSFTRLKLSSCKFGINKGRIACAESPRVKVLESVAVNYGESLKDTKSVSITIEPASERGIGMLTYSYDQEDRDNQTWLYLSALGRVKRIAGGDSEGDTEPASLFGSEFTTEDTDTGKLTEYQVNLLEETTRDNRAVWKLEMIPNKARAKKSRYSRTVNTLIKVVMLLCARRCMTSMAKR